MQVVFNFRVLVVLGIIIFCCHAAFQLMKLMWIMHRRSHDEPSEILSYQAVKQLVQVALSDSAALNFSRTMNDRYLTQGYYDNNYDQTKQTLERFLKTTRQIEEQLGYFSNLGSVPMPQDTPATAVRPPRGRRRSAIDPDNAAHAANAAAAVETLVEPTPVQEVAMPPSPAPAVPPDILTVADFLYRKYVPQLNRNLARETELRTALRTRTTQLSARVEALTDDLPVEEFLRIRANLLTDIADTTRDLTSTSTYLNGINAPATRRLPGFFNRQFLIDDLVALANNYENFTYNAQNHRMSVSTPDVTLVDPSTNRSYNLGRFRIVFNMGEFDGTNGDNNRFRIETLDPSRGSTGGSSGGYIHPHVSGGNMCPGDRYTGLVQTLPAAINGGRILDGFDLIYSLLRVYNPSSPHEHLSSWQSLQCHSCHNPVQNADTKRCYNCNHVNCGSCSAHCDRCDRDFCKTCGERDTVNRRLYHCPCENSIECNGCHESVLRTTVDATFGYCRHCLYDHLEHRDIGTGARMARANAGRPGTPTAPVGRPAVGVAARPQVQPATQPTHPAAPGGLPRFDGLQPAPTAVPTISPNAEAQSVGRGLRDTLAQFSLDDLRQDLLREQEVAPTPVPAAAAAPTPTTPEGAPADMETAPRVRRNGRWVAR